MRHQGSNALVDLGSLLYLGSMHRYPTTRPGRVFIRLIPLRVLRTAALASAR